ncbi:MAG: hypothetical protein NTY68_02360 [Candidatus Micrarchaeota archaeon]|nr:hypothetical protein [Candidatus Micrarchaeota archaeon]
MAPKCPGSASKDIHSSVEPSVKRIAKERKIENLGRGEIRDFVGIFKERVEARTLFVPVSSASAGTMIVERRISTEIIGKTRKKYGIISEKDYFESNGGKTIKHIEAKYIKDGNIEKISVEYDVTALVNAGSKTHELQIVEFVADSKGTLVYASKQYNENLDEYRREIEYDKGVYRDGIIGKYKIWDFMEGEEKEIMKNIFLDSKNGFHVVREINVPVFLVCLNCCGGLQCRGSNMTNVIISYYFKDGMFFYGAINNSKQSNREWGRVWSNLTSRKRFRFRIIKPFRINNEIKRARIAGGNAAPLLLSGFGSVFSSARDNDISRRIIAEILRGNGGTAKTNVKTEAKIGISGKENAAQKVSSSSINKLTNKLNSASSLNEIKSRMIEKITAKILNGMKVAMASKAHDLQTIRSVYLSRSKNPVIVLDVAKAAMLHRNFAASENVAVSRLSVAAKARMNSRSASAVKVKANAAKAIQNIEDRSKKINSSISGIILYLDSEIRRIEESINNRIGMIMFRIFSYITFGIRNYAEIRKVSYYPYVKSF